MANCPNCGAELAPSVLSCARCRMPLPPTQPGSGLWDPQSSGLWQTPAAPQGQQPPPGPMPQSQPSMPSSPARGASQYSPQSQYPPQARYSPQPPQPSPGTGGGAFLPPDDPEDERQRRNRRNTITLISLAAGVLLIALVSGIVVAVSTLSPSESAESAVPQAPTSAPVTEAPPPPDPTTPPPSTEAPPTSASPSRPPSSKKPEKGPTTTAKGTKWCTDTVGVPKSGTTCEFAEKVAAAVRKADPDAEEFTVDAHSPVTKKDYTMSCVRNSVLITCTGGNNATVWIKVGG
ncbi:MAG TPA: hypothetical protein IAA98_05640 [Candidatus Avipropionibacterium avicola]|uniref:Uncharacterized protein n=1 Tax=Candidatus Avipropionibacterium avicola TaxID=2840701 RepID=A0A9D1KLA9_9ACTN|nr:hypothetical protein [Candidatus Avipropionibacterium avicola]